MKRSLVVHGCYSPVPAKLQEGAWLSLQQFTGSNASCAQTGHV